MDYKKPLWYIVYFKVVFMFVLKNLYEDAKNILDKDHNKCPKCGGQLVKRVGKYGNFIGCSNYPRCKYAIYK